MQEEYIEEKLIIEKSESEKEEEIIKNIIRAKRELEASRNNFEEAKCKELVDYYIYQIKANQAKMDYLIKLAKTQGIFVNIINEVEIKFKNGA